MKKNRVIFYVKNITFLLLLVATIGFLAKTTDISVPFVSESIENFGWNVFCVLFSITFGLAVGIIIWGILSIFDRKDNNKTCNSRK